MYSWHITSVKYFCKNLFFLLFLFVICFPSVALADLKIGDAQGILDEAVGPTGITQSDLSAGTGQLIQGILGAMGMIFFVLMVYAGYLWMTARGEEDQITKARNTIISALIGLVITVGAYGLTAILVTRLQQGAAGGGGPTPTSVQGCCQDRVNALWACRITSSQDCTARGLTCEPGDDFCTPNDFNFNENIKEVQACVATCDARN